MVSAVLLYVYVLANNTRVVPYFESCLAAWSTRTIWECQIKYQEKAHYPDKSLGPRDVATDVNVVKVGK